MDSYTQVALGAVVGEAVLGRKVGAWAPVFGAIAGLIPDLDIYLFNNNDAVLYMIHHRGFTHSMLFAVTGGILMGWLLSIIFKKFPANWKDWSLMMILGLFTHALLDCLTTFGTQLFWPLNNYRVELSIMPFREYVYFSLLAIPVIAVLFFKRHSKIRRSIIWGSVIISCLYIVLAGINKWIFTEKFNQVLDRHNITYEKIRTTSTIYNITNWYGMAIKGDTIFHVTGHAYVSPEKWELKERYRNKELLNEWVGEGKPETIYWFTKGYFNVQQVNSKLKINDMRFGPPEDEEGEGNYVFSFLVYKENNETTIKWAGGRD